MDRLFRNTAIYVLGNAMNRLGALLLLPLYTRYLTTSQYGTLELYYSIASIVAGLLSIGIASATLRFYFEYAEQRDRNAVISTSFIASLGIGVLGTLLFTLALQPFVPVLIGPDAPAAALPLVLAGLLLELSAQVCLSYLRARELAWFFITVSFMKLLVQCAANVILLVQLEAGMVGVLTGNLIAVALGWLVVAVYTVRHCGLRFELDKLKPVLQYGLPFLYMALILGIAGNFDRFLVNSLLTLEVLGIYALALKFSKLISDLIGEPITRAFGAHRFTVMGKPEAEQVQRDAVRRVAILLAFSSLGLVYFTSDVLRVMAAPEYWGAAALMPFLVIASSLRVIIVLLQTGVLYSKKTGELVPVAFAGSAWAIAGAAAMTWAFGIQGTCASTVIDAAIGAWMTHRASQRYFPVRYEFGRIAWLIGITVAFGAIPYLLSPMAFLAEVAAKTALLIAYLVIVAHSPALRGDERLQLGAIARRLVSRARAR